MRITTNRSFCFFAIALTLLCSVMGGAGKKEKTVVISKELFHAIWMTESSGQVDPPDGDNGDSIGPYQISKAYFSDAKEFDKTITFEYEELRGNKEKSEQVIRAYMQRYAPDNATAEQIARIHNAGPRALTKERIRLTNKYWAKVREYLD